MSLTRDYITRSLGNIGNKLAGPDETFDVGLNLHASSSTKRPPPGDEWDISGSICFVFFTLWSLIVWLYGGTLGNALVGVSGQIGGLLMILIGKVCNCMGYLERMADESMRRDAMRSAVLSAQRDQPTPNV